MSEVYWVTSKMAKVWDEVYSQVFDYDYEVRKLDSIFKKYNVKNILDLGCGTGEHCIRLASLGYNCYGVDINRDLLQIAENKAKNRNIMFIQLDYLTSDLGELEKITGIKEFDAVIMLNMSHPIDNLLKVLENVKKILKANGIFLFNFINHESKDFPTFCYEIGEHVIRLNSFYHIDRKRIEWHMAWLFIERGYLSIEVAKSYLYKYGIDEIREILSSAGFCVESIDNENWVIGVYKNGGEGYGDMA